jgi:hypothetical protein
MMQVEILLERQEGRLAWVQEAAPMLESAYGQHQAVAGVVFAYRGLSLVQVELPVSFE